MSRLIERMRRANDARAPKRDSAVHTTPAEWLCNCGVVAGPHVHRYSGHVVLPGGVTFTDATERIDRALADPDTAAKVAAVREEMSGGAW